MTRKRILTLVMVFICAFVMIFPTSTYADSGIFDGWINPYSAIFNWNDTTEHIQGEKPLYSKHWLFEYTLDLDVGTTAITSVASPPTGGTMVTINTFLWGMLLLMGMACQIIISLSDWAFNQNYLKDQVVDQVDVFVDQLSDKLFFGELFTFAVFFLGVSLIFAFGRNEDIAGKLLKVILNLVVAFTLLANMGTIISSMYTLGKWGTEAVFTAFGNVPGFEMRDFDGDGEIEGRDTMLNVYDGFFKYNFYKPWQLAQFGLYVREDQSKWTAAERQVHQDTEQLLNGNRIWWQLEQTGKNLANVGKSLWNGLMFWNEDLQIDEETLGYGYISMTVAGVPFRALIIALTFVIGTAYGCFLLAIAGTTIFFQFFLILLALIAPLAFIIVLLPDYGDQVLLKWVQTVIGAAVYWILASLLFCMVLFLQHIAYEIADNWFVAMFLQLIILFTFFRFRKDVAEFFPALQMAAYTGAEQAFFEKSKELVDKGKEMAIEGGTVAVLGGAALATGNPALLGNTRSRVGSAAQGVLKGAMQMRKDAPPGEKPNMLKALKMSAKGETLKSDKQTAGKRGAVGDQQAGQQAGGVQAPALQELEAAALRAAAALQQLNPNQQMDAESRLEQQNVNVREGRHEIYNKEGKSVSLEQGQLMNGRTPVGRVQDNGEIRSMDNKRILGHVNSSNGQVMINSHGASQLGLSGPITAQIQTQMPTATVSTPPPVVQPTTPPVQVQKVGADGQRLVMQQAAPPGQGTTIINNYNTTNNYTQASSGGSAGGMHTIERITKHTETKTHKEIQKETVSSGTGSPVSQNISAGQHQPIEVKVDVGTSGVSVGGGGSSQPVVVNQNIQGGDQKITQEFKAGNIEHHQHQHDHLTYQDQSTKNEANESQSRSSVDLSGFATGNPAEIAKTMERMAKTAEKGEHEMNRVERMVNRMKRIFGKKE